MGFLYGRRAGVDRTKNPETGEVYNQNVMGDRVMMSGLELMFNFQLIMLIRIMSRTRKSELIRRSGIRFRIRQMKCGSTNMCAVESMSCMRN